MEHLQRKQQRSRKRHDCHLCGKQIAAGVEYIQDKYVADDKKIVTLKRHIHCDAMLQAYNSTYNDDDVYEEQDVMDTIWQEVCKDICGEEEREECFEDPACMYSCYLCQTKMLHPSILGAAVRSVRENYENRE